MNNHTRFLVSVATMVAMIGIAGCSKTPEPTQPTTSTSATATTAPGNVSDMDVTEHVKTALQQNASLKGTDITVVTLKGDVRLTGVLANQAQIDEAIKIARSSDGAHAVHDELTLKK